MSGRDEWDVAVVGAGPAGLSAAWVAARAGIRTVVLERARHPRYKTCGGGLIATSAVTAAARMPVPARDQIYAATFTRDGRQSYTRRTVEPLLTMVRRDEFDDALRRAAVESGAVVRQRSMVRTIVQDEHRTVARLADGTEVVARYLVGADGSAGVAAGHVGARYEQVDLGMEAELAVPEVEQRRWCGRVLLDWGRLPGSYGWVFPKGDQLTVGVIAARDRGDGVKAYLDQLVDRCGLAGAHVVERSGHLVRCRTADSPLYRGRVLLAGDAGGLVEPWSREGISFALRSGGWAGEAVVAAVSEGGDPRPHLAHYRRIVEASLGTEMGAGRRLLAAFTRHPALFHAMLATPPGWRAFARFCRGEAAFASVLGRAPARAIVTGLGRW